MRTRRRGYPAVRAEDLDGTPTDPADIARELGVPLKEVEQSIQRLIRFGDMIEVIGPDGRKLVAPNFAILQDRAA